MMKELCGSCGKAIKGIGIDAVCINHPNNRINEIRHYGCLRSLSSNPSIARIGNWLTELQIIGKRHHIRPTNKQDDRSARRIAILVSESFLRHFRMKQSTIPYPHSVSTPVEEKSYPEDRRIHYAGFIECAVYRETKHRCLYCAEIEEEERTRNLGRKGHGFDPLKLHPETHWHNSEDIQRTFDKLLSHIHKKEGIPSGKRRRQARARRVQPRAICSREIISPGITDK
jgi:hypothetical protein